LSKVAIKGASTGTATFTIESPATNTNRTLTLPDAAGTVVTDSATQTLTNKTINASQLVDASITAAKLDGAQSGSAPIYAARAWVNFDGGNAFSPNPSTSAIRGSGNISSINRTNTGRFTVNFTTAMPDANYSVSGAASKIISETNTTDLCTVSDGTYSTSAFDIEIKQAGSTNFRNAAIICVSVFR
jgi:hypothetical protein